MKLTVLTLAVIVAAVGGCSEGAVQSTMAPTFNTAVEPLSAKRSIVEFDGLHRKDFNAAVAALGGTVDFVADGAGFAGVSGLSAEASATLARSAGVASVYDDVVVQLDSRGRRGEALGTHVFPMSTANPAAAAGFEEFQWNMRAISAPAAWAGGNLGSPSVTAAILDSGIDYDNLDMSGLVDLSRSVSFVPSDDALLAALFPSRNTLDDLSGHGTLVASQVSSNAVVFAGVSSRTRLMGIKVLGFAGSGSLGGIFAGVIWAADHGADVANISIGIPNGFDKAGNGAIVELFNRVFTYAKSAGMAVVVAAGNDAQDLDGDGSNFAAFCEASNVICVSATGPTSGAPFAGPWGNVDAFASYSDFGKQDITLAAPGGSDFGFVDALCARHYIEVIGSTLTFPCDGVPSVLGGAGTSAAAPHVTGVVAQLIAKYGKGKPSQIKQLLLNGVDDLGAPGKDPFYGAGRVNLAKAMSQ